MNGAKIVENIFFTVTCISVFTCVIRSDYNFAMGLLSYYMIKNIGNKQGTEISKIARTVSFNVNYAAFRMSSLHQTTYKHDSFLVKCLLSGRMGLLNCLVCIILPSGY